MRKLTPYQRKVRYSMPSARVALLPRRRHPFDFRGGAVLPLLNKALLVSLEFGDRCSISSRSELALFRGRARVGVTTMSGTGGSTRMLVVNALVSCMNASRSAFQSAIVSLPIKSKAIGARAALPYDNF
jgi:hypothetical protein